MKIDSMIEKPTLLLDKARALNNIERMAGKAAMSGVRLRAHFKTHQSAEIGQWFRPYGVSTITVSSVDMALYFAEHGWNDITIAFPVNLRQIRTINLLARQVQLNLLFESAEVGIASDRLLKARVGAWLKIDCGYQRTGIAWENDAEIAELASVIQDCQWLDLKGILTHAGHSYATTSPRQVRSIYEQSLRRMKAVQENLRGDEFSASISVGDTPGCSLAAGFRDIDEIRPGNFVFFDLTQLAIGSCQESDIAVAMACPVVAIHPERKQLLIYGGAIHFSKEGLLWADGTSYYGRVALNESDGWGSFAGNSRLVSLSQEHGLIDADPELMSKVRVGDIVTVIPIHSCLTANLMGRYLSLAGDWIDMAR